MRRYISIFIVTLLVLLISPATASFVLSGVTLSPPDIPLQTGQNLSLDSTLVILPSGTTTFNKGHEIQITTELLSPAWDVQVMVNCNPAAKIPDQGNAVFINGYLLSYPANQDVSVFVRVTGMVPASSDPDIVLLQAEEIDNSGNIVPGSVQTVTEPVGQMKTTPPTTADTSDTPAYPAAAASVTRSKGFSLLTGIAAIFAVTTAMFVRSRKRK